MKYISLIVFILLSKMCYSQVHAVIKPDGSYYEFTRRDGDKDNDRLDGLHIIFYDSLRHLIKKTYYLKGRHLHGVANVFNKVGQILKQEYYYDGDKDGVWLTWNNKGILISKKIYQKGKLIQK